MNLPFAVVHDTDQLRTVLEHQMQVDAVLIDTPGMGPNDPAMREEVRRLLQSADPDETHLVVNATIRPEVLAAIVDTFRPLGINRLLFTQLDGFACHPDMEKQIDQHRLPSSFLTDGADLAGHLEETTVD